MKSKTLAMCFSGMVALLTASTTVAQSGHHRPGANHREPRTARVTLFAQANYQGESVTLTGGERMDDFNTVRFPSGRSINNRISSIRIEGRARVTLYDYRGFVGQDITLRESSPRLDRVPLGKGSDWNNRPSSVVVRPNGSSRDTEHADVNNRGGHGRDAVIRAEVVQVVTRAYQDILGRRPDSSGMRHYTNILERRGWSATQLREELRRSAEYRNTVVPRIVKTAYRDILQREADHAGLKFYSTKMIQAEWTEGRVREALEKSPEYLAAQNQRRGQPFKEKRSTANYANQG